MHSINRIDVEDVLAVSAIDSEAFGPNAYPPPFFRQAYELYAETFFVASNVGKIIGYCVGAPTAMNPLKGWILSLAVSRDHRRQGHGSRLLSRTIDALRDIGCNEVLLSVHPENDTARALFEKHGFVVTKTESEYFGRGEPRNIMRVMLHLPKQGRRK